jgi:hypothetical protein
MCQVATSRGGVILLRDYVGGDTIFLSQHQYYTSKEHNNFAATYIICVVKLLGLYIIMQ